MRRALLLLTIGLTALLSAQTIEEKRLALAGSLDLADRQVPTDLKEINAQLATLKGELSTLHTHAQDLLQGNAPEDEYAELVDHVREVRGQMSELEGQWRAKAVAQGNDHYALWHQPWSSVEQLVMDYGSADYVYAIPPEVGALRLSVMSNIPVPRESWDEMLQLILTQNGVGIKQLNPYLRSLYLVASAPNEIGYVTSERTELDTLPPEGRLCFVLSPPPADTRDVYNFLERFAQPNQTALKCIGRQIFIFSTVAHAQELLKVYDFVATGALEREYQMIPLTKISSTEMESILSCYFEGSYAREEGAAQPGGLRILSLADVPSSIFVAGPPDAVRQAQKLITDVEGQISDPKQMIVHTYTVQHSEVEELAGALSQVYSLMLANPSAVQDAETIANQMQSQAQQRVDANNGSYSGGCCPPYLQPAYSPSCNPNQPINPAPVGSSPTCRNFSLPETMGNFVVSPKTGTIIMVVQQELLAKLQQLIRKLDVPKKMVRIDVLLCEKQITDKGQFGLDFLRIGSAAFRDGVLPNGFTGTGALFNDCHGPFGLLRFIGHVNPMHHMPGLDLIYNFLMTREDIRVNANPSVTTVNNTEAKIELVEEISIDNGTYIVPNAANGITQKSFTRSQYGITIVITPTVNSSDDNIGPDFITLDTSVLFDTPKQAIDDRPPVLRRRITNEVRIPNGQTVVLGGLRSRMTEETDAGLPFISEIPLFGKLFSFNKTTDRDTEMFIFITPRIIDDPSAEMCRMQRELLCRRPGDCPEYLKRICQAHEYEQQCAFERTLKTLFGSQSPCFGGCCR